MSIIQTQTTSFKAELYEGIHNLLTDTLRIALYTAEANLNEATTAYSATAEVTGSGYVAGGVTLTGVTINSSGYTAYVNFNNVAFGAALTARCALIYNASKANRSIAVLDFGSDKTSASFTITMPQNTATTALIRSSI
jgi:hypothetical protein